MRALEDPELFPGGVPTEMSSAVFSKVENYLQRQPETKNLGLSAPSPDSVDRALKLYWANKQHRAK
jgi:hypothetical protein